MNRLLPLILLLSLLGACGESADVAPAVGASSPPATAAAPESAAPPAAAGTESGDTAAAEPTGKSDIVPEPKPPPSGAATVASTGTTLQVLLADSLQVVDADGKPQVVATLPLVKAQIDGSVITPLFDVALAASNQLVAAQEAGGAPFAGVADVRVATDSTVNREDLARVLSTLAEAQFGDASLWLGERGPLKNPPIVARKASAPGDPRLGDVVVSMHKTATESWASAVATWTEAPLGSIGGQDGMRPDLHVPLAGDDGCYLLKPGPSRGLAPGLDARLKVYGLDVTSRVHLAATSDTAVTHALALSLDLQKKGWTVLQADADGVPPNKCPEAARSNADLTAAQKRFLKRKR